MSNEMEAWPEADETQDLTSLFAPSPVITGEIADRHGLLSYGNAEDLSGIGRNPFLSAVRVNASVFLERCDPSEWHRIQMLLATARGYHLERSGRYRITFIVTSEEANAPLAADLETKALRRLGLTAERAREICRAE